MSTTFAPITLNGEPVITWRDLHYVEVGGHVYAQESAASEDCWCRRCALHDDFGGCIVEEAIWALVTFR